MTEALVEVSTESMIPESLRALAAFTYNLTSEILHFIRKLSSGRRVFGRPFRILVLCTELPVVGSQNMTAMKRLLVLRCDSQTGACVLVAMLLFASTLLLRAMLASNFFVLHCVKIPFFVL